MERNKCQWRNSQGGLVIFITFHGRTHPDDDAYARMGRKLHDHNGLILAVIYWCIALPNRVGIIYAWLMGLVLDVATGSLMGQNALAFSIVAFLAIKLHLRIRLFPVWQQALSILILVALYQNKLFLWVKGFTGQSAQNWFYWDGIIIKHAVVAIYLYAITWSETLLSC